MRIIKFLLLCLGFYILYITIKSVDIAAVGAQLVELKWKLLPILIIYPFIFFFDTLGWACAFPKSLPDHVPMRDLYFIRIIGEALNAIVPGAASLGGEPIKAELLRSRHNIPLSEGYASILIVHTTLWIALNIFVIGGLLVTFKTLPLTPILWKSVLTFLFVLGLIAILLVIGLHLGIFTNVHSLGENLKWWKDKSGEKKERYLKLDESIKKFYTQDRWRFIASSFFSFLGWFMGAVEVYWLGNILGMRINFAEAWLLEALIQVLRIVTFFIPSSIGAQEGGIVVIFAQFGFGNAVSITFAILRRLREILWVAVGLLLWSFIEDKPKLKSAPVDQAG